ncbi:MAG: sucrose phosphorylase [Lutibacter sp.]|uniref:sucrose phosphorylase n=1 Tax=Lutibacter sp. TaxID=1925666 RepID=UPI00299D75EC|nr:sucrose phosphorylase [Lutibacter sp.]MDX1828531.1 sucrose phosphorylase [Lutibacter sp.]
MKNQIQLITYIDRLGCKNIDELNSLFKNEFKGLFGGIHLLPFFYPIDGEDAGFDPIDHQLIDPRFGDWNDLNKLSKEVDIMADVIVNHISAKSHQFKDYIDKGNKSKYASMFLSFDKVFPDGALENDLLTISRPRLGFPFTLFKLGDGTHKLIWTTFTSNQIDIDITSKIATKYLDDILTTFQKAGVKMVRLDAAGYAVKKKGTSCFMIDETFDFISQLTQKAKQKNIEVLVEIHSYYKTQIAIAKKVDYVYDFALPVLIFDTLFNKKTNNLKKWLKIRPSNAITVLDTHDGIGIIDVASENKAPGLIDNETLNQIINQIHVNSENNSLKSTGTAASNLDLYQVNCTYFDALGKDINAYLIARAIQFFIPGIPQVYYVGLFAGGNDMELLEKTNVGRDINRHYFSKNEINIQLKTPYFKKLKELILLRNNHNAFNGEFHLLETEENILHIKWITNNDWAELIIDLLEMKMQVKFSE